MGYIGLSAKNDIRINATSDLELTSDNTTIKFGADDDVTITHDPDDGLIFKSIATADDNPFLLTIQTGETDLAANDVIGKIQFQAPDEGTGTDAVLVSAAIQAVSEGDFSSSSNATRLEFMTGASEAATAKMTLSSAGVLDVDGGVTIDNITIDGTEIDLSSGSLTIDVADNIALDSGSGDFYFKDTGSTFLNVYETSDHAYLHSTRSDADIIFKGNDGGSTITALTLDMSEGGRIGVGIGVPDQKMHVFQASTAGSGIVPLIKVQTDTNNNTGDGSGIEFHGKYSGGEWGFGKIGGANSGANYGGALEFHTNTGNGSSVSTTFTKKMTLDHLGNLAIGATPVTWNSGNTALQIGGNGILHGSTALGASKFVGLTHNAHIDSDGSWEYISTDEASNYYQSGGAHYFRTASSGTAGNDITWTTTLTINSSGGVDASFFRAANFYTGVGSQGFVNTNTNDFKITNQDNTIAIYGENGGDVGIGTSTMAANSRLTIAGADNSNYLAIRNTSASDGSSYRWGYIRFEGTQSGGEVTTLARIGAFHDGTADDQKGVFTIATNDGDDGVNPTERMRIDSSGNVLIGDTSGGTSQYSAPRLHIDSADDKNGIIIENIKEGYAGLGVDAYDATGTIYPLYIINSSGSTVGTVSSTSSATSFNTSSDYRLKENVSYSWDATTRLKQLKPCEFNFKNDTDNTVTGFLAHEVSSIVPTAVTGEKDAMTLEELYGENEPIPDGKSIGDVKKASVVDPQQIDHSKLVPLLVKTIQELEARIETLEAEVAKLKE